MARLAGRLGTYLGQGLGRGLGASLGRGLGEGLGPGLGGRLRLRLGAGGPAQLGLAPGVLRLVGLGSAGGRTEADLVWLGGVRRTHLRVAASA